MPHATSVFVSSMKSICCSSLLCIFIVLTRIKHSLKMCALKSVETSMYSCVKYKTNRYRLYLVFGDLQSSSLSRSCLRCNVTWSQRGNPRCTATGRCLGSRHAQIYRSRYRILYKDVWWSETSKVYFLAYLELWFQMMPLTSWRS